MVSWTHAEARLGALKPSTTWGGGAGAGGSGGGEHTSFYNAGSSGGGGRGEGVSRFVLVSGDAERRQAICWRRGFDSDTTPGVTPAAWTEQSRRRKCTRFCRSWCHGESRWCLL